jgi:uncharacterized protein YciI
MARRDAVRAEHRAYVVTHDAPIVLVGPFIDEGGNQCGSFYIFEAHDEQQVRAWLQQEPFVSHDVYAELLIRRFEPGLNRLPLQDWPTRAPT